MITWRVIRYFCSRGSGEVVEFYIAKMVQRDEWRVRQGIGVLAGNDLY